MTFAHDVISQTLLNGYISAKVISVEIWWNYNKIYTANFTNHSQNVFFYILPDSVHIHIYGNVAILLWLHATLIDN